MTDHLFVLGASDPEMSAIETLLTECGVPFVYATIGGRRVSAGEAYKYAEIDIGFDAKRAVVRDHGTLHLVECDIEIDPEDIDIVTVLRHDHHRPGDPGFGRGPEEFLEASSIGQVIAALARLGALPESWFTTLENSPSCAGLRVGEWTGGRENCIVSVADCGEGPVVTHVPWQIAYTAAADHCLGAAYAGRCPGVDPDELLRHRVAARAAFQDRDAGSILADIAAARLALEAATELDLLSHQCDWHAAGHSGSDDCQSGSGTAYSGEPCRTAVADLRGTHVPELPEAGTRYGIAYVADGLPGPDGRVKIVCSGPREVIEAFLVWAPRNLLVDCYGDPARGFAGAYQVPVLQAAS